jgi:hypothetical protein
MISNIPLRRLGQPEEIGARLFILQDDYYNVALEIDGGLRL